MNDLVILAADKDVEFALRGLLSRQKALCIRSITTELFVMPGHDPACAVHGVEFLSNFAQQFEHGLLVFDHEGSGQEAVIAAALEETLNADFRQTLWKNRARALVLSPELEAWVWSKSPHVDTVAGWRGRVPDLRQWLLQNGWLEPGQCKPKRPKEAFEAALREARKSRSAALFKQMAEKVSVRGCEDTAFQTLITILQAWFPPDS